MIDCPLAGWRTYRNNYPSVHTLSQLIVAIPAGQCEVERLSSIAGCIVNPRRNRLGMHRLNDIMSVDQNHPPQGRDQENVDNFINQESELLDLCETEYESLNDVEGDGDSEAHSGLPDVEERLI